MISILPKPPPYNSKEHFRRMFVQHVSEWGNMSNDFRTTEMHLPYWFYWHVLRKYNGGKRGLTSFFSSICIHFVYMCSMFCLEYNPNQAFLLFVNFY